MHMDDPERVVSVYSMVKRSELEYGVGGYFTLLPTHNLKKPLPGVSAC